jgi:hypothetical protein
VVAEARAQFKGSGTINGQPGYGFMSTAIDGDRLGGNQPDRFRIKIWEVASGVVVYDNQDGTGDAAVQGGSVLIHAK